MQALVNFASAVGRVLTRSSTPTPQVGESGAAEGSTEPPPTPSFTGAGHPASDTPLRNFTRPIPLRQQEWVSGTTNPTGHSVAALGVMDADECIGSMQSCVSRVSTMAGETKYGASESIEPISGGTTSFSAVLGGLVNLGIWSSRAVHSVKIRGFYNVLVAARRYYLRTRVVPRTANVRRIAVKASLLMFPHFEPQDVKRFTILVPTCSDKDMWSNQISGQIEEFFGPQATYAGWGHMVLEFGFPEDVDAHICGYEREDHPFRPFYRLVLRCLPVVTYNRDERVSDVGNHLCQWLLDHPRGNLDETFRVFARSYVSGV